MTVDFNLKGLNYVIFSFASSFNNPFIPQNTPAPVPTPTPAQGAILQNPTNAPQPLDPATITHIKSIDLKKYRDLPVQFNRLERWLWLIPVIGWIALIIIHCKRKNCRLKANGLLNNDLSKLPQAIHLVDSTLKWRYVYERGKEYLLAGKYREALVDFTSLEIEDELCEGDDFPTHFLYLKANAFKYSGDLWNAYVTYQTALAHGKGKPDFQTIVAQASQEMGCLDQIELLLTYCRKEIAQKTDIAVDLYKRELSPRQWTPEFNKHINELVRLAQAASLEKKIEIAQFLLSLTIQSSWCFEQANLLLLTVIGNATIEQKINIATFIQRDPLFLIFITQTSIERKFHIAALIKSFDQALMWLNSAYSNSAPNPVQRGKVAYELGRLNIKKYDLSQRYPEVKFTEDDAKKMLAFFEEALQLDVEKARDDLVLIYESGKGVSLDFAKGHFWRYIHGKSPDTYQLRALAKKYESKYKYDGQIESLKSSLEWYEKALANATSKKEKFKIQNCKDDIARVKALIAQAPNPII